ncbi:MAG: AAA family ATPase [Candidatus Bathyarchaeia archaeon]
MAIIQLKHKIGLVYVPGALPCFEKFGNLPTHLVREDGVVEGKPASEVLDMLIIPGGSLVESGFGGNLPKEVLRIAESGGFLLGVCAGFQILAKATDVGRLSPTPIVKKGLGLLDVEFSPLICTDRVTASVVGRSFLTEEVGVDVTGFHCHTYGSVTIKGDAKPILVSRVKRMNYRDSPQEIVSGVSNKEGNVVGVLVHALLDENPAILEGIKRSLGISPEEFEAIKEANVKLQAEMKEELGVATGLYIDQNRTYNPSPSCLLFTATESSAGKTFILTGVAGALRRRGINVGVLKVGGDIRDIVPALYLTKETMMPYSSIRIGSSGWTLLEEAVLKATCNHSLLLIEGAMGDLTGLLNENVEHPSSTLEVAVAAGIPLILIVGCDKSGLEGALVDALSHIALLRNLGAEVAGVILNKLRLSYMSEEVERVTDQAFKKYGVSLLGLVPRMELEERGMIPEVEIRYETFCKKALETVERYIKIDELLKLAKAPHISKGNLNICGKFKRLLTSSFWDEPFTIERGS